MPVIDKNSAEYQQWERQQGLTRLLSDALNDEDIHASRLVAQLFVKHDYVCPLWFDFCNNVTEASTDNEVLQQVHLLKKTTQHRFTNRPGERESRMSCAIPLELL